MFCLSAKEVLAGFSWNVIAFISCEDIITQLSPKVNYLSSKIRHLRSATGRVITSIGQKSRQRRRDPQPAALNCNTLPNLPPITDGETVSPNAICDEIIAGDVPVEFQCNICGKENEAAINIVSNREAASCKHCRSSLRMRSLIYALSLELFGEAFTLPNFPKSTKIIGAGMSDWEGYAFPLSQKFGYTNTYYHKKPKLDITQIGGSHENTYDFIISSDVFEHIPHPISVAFVNTCRLLKPGGLFIFTTPYEKHGITREYYPNLFDYKFEKRDGKTVMINTTVDGVKQIFTDLVFHGGDGFTLELRMFTEPSLRRELENANFTSTRFHNQHFPRFGIIWPIDWALPITARKTTTA